MWAGFNDKNEIIYFNINFIKRIKTSSFETNITKTTVYSIDVQLDNGQDYKFGIYDTREERDEEFKKLIMEIERKEGAYFIKDSGVIYDEKK